MCSLSCPSLQRVLGNVVLDWKPLPLRILHYESKSTDLGWAFSYLCLTNQRLVHIQNSRFGLLCIDITFSNVHGYSHSCGEHLSFVCLFNFQHSISLLVLEESTHMPIIVEHSPPQSPRNEGRGASFLSLAANNRDSSKGVGVYQSIR